MASSTRPLLPLYYRVSKTLEQRIRDQQYRVGQRFPSEDALCREFRVSRMTIRQALAGLVDAGLVVRRRGSGSFVKARIEGGGPSRAITLTGALEDLFAQVETAQVEGVRIVEEPPPRDVQEAMGLPEGEGVTVVRRVRAIDDQPFAVTLNYLPTWLGRRLRKEDLYRYPLLQLLEERHHILFRRADQTVEARLADEDIAKDLGITFGDAVLFVERRMFGAGDRPVEVVRSHYRADVYSYKIRLVRTRRVEFPWRPAGQR
ncbi:MAG: hypothetical protein A3F92_07630 [Candidatus Rokubacteria bacterium RIFCSPLOWO2_12_FULL_71_22]|nr:MAG: hypothetical protein A3F92_07630 [Candidatus Rokubacteria bacterium RIFCSPLOWO2_12_FULL_71_22]